LLSATCIKIDGSYNNTSIRIPGIENINGVLTFNNSYSSSSWISKPGSRSPDEAIKPCVKQGKRTKFLKPLMGKDIDEKNGLNYKTPKPLLLKDSYDLDEFALVREIG